MRHPLLPIVTAFIFGLLFSHNFSVIINHTLIALIIVLILTSALYFKSKIFLSFLYSLLAFFLAGSLNYALHQKNLNLDPLLNLWEEKKHTELSEPVEIFGVINTMPEIRQDLIYLNMKLTKIATSKESYEISGGIRLRVRLRSPHFDNLHHFEYGDYIRTITALNKPNNYDNDGCFDYRTYLRNRGIFLIGSVESPLLIEVVKKGLGNPILHFCQKVRDLASHQINHYFKNEKGYLAQEGAFIKSITLGERSRLNINFIEELQKAGTYHILAISGLHIFIISYFLFHLLTLFNISDRIKSLIIIAFLGFYTLLAGGRISVLRATIMASIYLMGRVLHQESDMLNSLCLACLIILLYKPDQLFDAGFQLSFAATFSIILLAPKLTIVLKQWPLKIGEIVAITLAAQIGIAPVLIYHFNRISPVSLISNLIAFPLILAVIILGFLFFILSFTFPAAAEVIAELSQILIQFFRYLLKLLNKIPYSQLRIPEPPFWIIIIYYILFVVFIIIGFKRRCGKILIGTWLLSLIFILSSPLPPSSSPYLKINFLDVGRGDSIVIEFPGQEIMLLDGGGSLHNISYIGESVISPFLWHRRIKEIDIVVLSHPHYDHLGGLFAMLENFKIKEIWYGNFPKNSQLFESFIKKAKSKNIKIFKKSKGFRKKINGVEIEILNPLNKEYISRKEINDNSLVLMLTYGKNKMLLTGDIEERAERELIMSYGNNLQCEVLKLPHHGSITPYSEEFLNTAQPKVVIISGWLPFTQQEPSKDTFYERQCKNKLIYRTIKHGQTTIISNGNYIQIKTFNQKQ